ncbi:uncharacterized protein CYBJADRAFT_188451 [Cyberlindnera jadinii NRRL Y-1542]|uniref:Uncharacterized protein n=1 Tax=Cyberlindnera jadinii (strain ATCC 18201 / CBS 1600 / BCRC 20928 / JCM 3617 / NBRC 0987 / NRRL Y-1542) TaxID=983966 RepID=A0A1E4S713_CYBJN|nr:hypothetical protein CYBJADRAFT_188451 [Cyberlindnera jadinii NRRL Y-1542]ODV75314.1 hypothetical protein CYBJADRAFT_188451 [Cyberlindnera jadinii NRRL Y-1542]
MALPMTQPGRTVIMRCRGNALPGQCVTGTICYRDNLLPGQRSIKTHTGKSLSCAADRLKEQKQNNTKE